MKKLLLSVFLFACIAGSNAQTIYSRTTIKNWFLTGSKPTQQQYWNWLDSYVHKNDSVPFSMISGAVPGVVFYGKNTGGDSTVLILSNGQRFAAKDNNTGSGSGSYHLPFNGLATDYLGGDTAYHHLSGVNVSTFPNDAGYITKDSLSGGDTTVFNTVLDSTGQPQNRLLFGVGKNKIGSSSKLNFDSTKGKLVINNKNNAFGGADKRLAVNGNGYFNGTLKVGAFTIPATDGTNGQILKTNGSGVVAWQQDNTGGGGTGSNNPDSLGGKAASEYQLIANKSNSTTLGTSNTLYPSQNAVKAYVDNSIAGIATPTLQQSYNVNQTTVTQRTIDIGASKYFKLYSHNADSTYKSNYLQSEGVIQISSSIPGGFSSFVLNGSLVSFVSGSSSFYLPINAPQNGQILTWHNGGSTYWETPSTFSPQSIADVLSVGNYNNNTPIYGNHLIKVDDNNEVYAENAMSQPQIISDVSNGLQLNDANGNVSGNFNDRKLYNQDGSVALDWAHLYDYHTLDEISRTVTVDYTTGTNFTLDITNEDAIDFSNFVVGKPIYITVRQDASGGHSLTFPSNTKFSFGIATGTTLNLTTTAGAEDDICVKYDGSYYRVYLNANMQ